tara:strand:+ start:61 stop:447 length:387 start_codon:yes stop_codon:yes gene_type:complete
MSADVGTIAIRLQDIEKDVNKQEKDMYRQTIDVQGNFKREMIFKEYFRELTTIREQLKDRKGTMESMLKRELESLTDRVDELYQMSQQQTSNARSRTLMPIIENRQKAIEESLRGVTSKMTNPYCVYI